MRQVIEVDIDKIEVNPHQPRQNFRQEDLDSLADSIRAVGLIHPPVVRVTARGYQIVAGERRYRAAGIAGLTKIPVLVDETTEEQSAEAALIENIQRVDLNPLEIATALKRLIEDFGLSQEELAQRVGKKRSTIANYLRLLQLPQDVKESLASGEITMGHAKVLLSVEGAEQRTLFGKLLERPMSVREIESLVEKKMQAPAIPDWVQNLEQRLQTKVKPGRGRFTVHYRSEEELERILELLHA